MLKIFLFVFYIIPTILAAYNHTCIGHKRSISLLKNHDICDEFVQRWSLLFYPVYKFLRIFWSWIIRLKWMKLIKQRIIRHIIPRSRPISYMHAKGPLIPHPPPPSHKKKKTNKNEINKQTSHHLKKIYTFTLLFE